jgi:hypothetical protein
MLRFSGKVSVSGILDFKVYRRGVLIDEFEDHNLVVNGAKLQTARSLAGATTIAKIAFGTSGTSPDVTDTGITNQYVKALSGYSFPDTDRVQFDWKLTVAENNGSAIREFGLLTADGVLFARKTRVNPIYKESDISIEGHWTVIVSQAEIAQGGE